METDRLRASWHTRQGMVDVQLLDATYNIGQGERKWFLEYCPRHDCLGGRHGAQVLVSAAAAQAHPITPRLPAASTDRRSS